jgi:phosphonate transport system ATP-binding protein
METNSRRVPLRLVGAGVVYPGGVRALHPTDLAFREGQFVVFLGSSGAGKSTLLRCINQLVIPTEGSIQAQGYGNLAGHELRRFRQSTGMIFQQHQLHGRLTVLQNVLHGRLGRYPAWRTWLPFPRADQELALRCLDRVGLLDQALTRADQLSGGQQQRVGIARALAQEPRIILADEPVASLDPANARAFLELLRAVCLQDRILAILSLHQVELARTYADRIVGLKMGRVVFDGAPESLSEEVLASLYDAEEGAFQPSPRFVPFPDLVSEIEELAV